MRDTLSNKDSISGSSVTGEECLELQQRLFNSAKSSDWKDLLPAERSEINAVIIDTAKYLLMVQRFLGAHQKGYVAGRIRMLCPQMIEFKSLTEGELSLCKFHAYLYLLTRLSWHSKNSIFAKSNWIQVGLYKSPTPPSLLPHDNKQQRFLSAGDSGFQILRGTTSDAGTAGAIDAEVSQPLNDNGLTAAQQQTHLGSSVDSLPEVALATKTRLKTVRSMP